MLPAGGLRKGVIAHLTELTADPVPRTKAPASIEESLIANSTESRTTETLTLPNGSVEIDRATGAITTLRLEKTHTEFVRDPSGRGLLRLAAPLGHYASHFLETGTHGSPDVSRDGEQITLHYPSLESGEDSYPIQVDITLRPSEDGLVMRATVHNGWSEPLPQVIFPQLMDLEAVGGVDDTRVQLGRYRMHPFQKLVMRPDDAAWLDRALHEYVPYADFKFNMKWLDYGDEAQGLTLYSRNTRHTAQGILIQRVDRAVDRVNLRWSHYPFVGPGETWDSGEYVLMPHAGDWYAGARAYQAFAAEHYPYNAPTRLREALAIRSLWPAARNAPPNFMFSELPDYAEEVADAELGVTEIVLWHWWLKNGYPVFVDERLGAEEEFRDALKRCEEIGVPIVLFFSHHILRDTDETDPDWVHLNAGHQPVGNNWTYGRDFLPVFRLPFSGTHAMIQGSALSPGWRQTGLDAYKHFLELGGKGICFDVYRSWEDPNFNSAIDGRPDEEGEKLLEFARKARELIYDVNPDGTFSAEQISDVNVPVVDYTWEWFNSYHHADAAPFRYVFPQVRLNANVNEHPRGALIGFMEGSLINLMPGNMRSYRLRDCPDLVAMMRSLTPLRRRFLPYFTEGQYRFKEGLTVTGGDARLYTHGDRILVIAINPGDTPADVTVAVDPSVWGGDTRTGTLTATDLDGNEIERAGDTTSAFQRTARLDADTLRIFEFSSEG